MNPEAVRETARLAYRLGLRVIPPREDGTKRPIGRWKEYQAQRPDPDQMREWFSNSHEPHGIGLIMGDGIECLEFEDRDIYQLYRDTAEAGGLGDLIDRIEAGYMESTPGGGIHWLYYCDEVSGNTKLASRPAEGQLREHWPVNVDVLIETRGEGGYVIIAPSHGPVHASGGAYELISGGLDQIATITPDERQELFLLARAFDESPKQDYRPANPEPTPIDGTSPGNDYIAQTTWPELLEPHGWQFVYQRGDTQFWRRPGKRIGISATINGEGVTPDRMYVFTSSTELEPNRSYTRFQAYAFLEHAGDFHAAAKELAAQDYGTQDDGARLLLSVFEDREQERQDDPDAEPVERKQHPWIVDVFDLLQEPDEPDIWQVEGMIRHPSVTLIAGPAKTYKSFLAQEMAIAVATGSEMFQRFGVYEPRNVVYIQDESSRRAVRSRFRSLMNGRGMPPFMVKDSLFTITNQNFQLDDPEHIRRLVVEAIEVHNPELIILDPLAEMHNANENDSREIRPVLRAMKEIRDRYQISVVVLHHNNKNPEYTNPADSIRGSTAIWASMDGGIFLSSTKDDNQKKVVVELKEGGQVDPFFFVLDGTDDGLTFDVIPVDKVQQRGVSDSDIVSCVNRLGWSTIDDLANELPVSKRTLQPRLNALAGRNEIQRRDPAHKSQKIHYGPLEMESSDD